MAMRAKKPVQPFPLPKKYPSSFERFIYRSYNSLDNRLWPVRPSVFVGSAVAVGAYNLKFPQNALMEFLPSSSNAYLQLAKVCAASVACVYIPIVILRQILKRTYFSYKGFLFENPKKPSWKTQLWGLVRKILSISPPILKSCDLLLPSPSCPDLDETIKRYLQSVKNLHSPDEFALIKEQAMEFLNGEGRKLHNYARLYSLFADNYVTPFWEKYAYLYSKSPLLINSSVAHIDLFEDRPATVAVRAAHVVYIEAMSHLAMDKQAIKPLGDGLVCSRHYEKMYAVTRVPDENCDFLMNYGISKHFVVFYKGNFYKAYICDQNNRIFSIDQLTKIFVDIIARAEKEPAVGPVAKLCALTHDTRDQWARNRRKFFLNNPVNKKTLEAIEQAIMFFVLDDNEGYGYDPQNPDVVSKFLKTMLTGTGVDRWCDKSLNYQVNVQTARAGGTTEHSIADGAEFDHIMENFVEMDVNYIKYPTLEEQRVIEVITEEDKKAIIFGEKLEVDLTDEMVPEIERCLTTHVAAADDVDLAATVFRDWGKGLIKKCGVSPDAFVQMAIQIANYRDQGKFSLTYEPASARFYKFSRTETLRTVTDETCAFVLAMHNMDTTKEDRIELLKKACNLHGVRNRECMVGKGIDRHLFVLFVLSKGFGICSPFLEHYISQKWLLSTSHVPNVTNQNDEDTNINNTWIGACFGAVAKEGYGICYRFGGNHSILAHISSYHSAENTSSSRFRGHLVDAFHEMAALFDLE